MRGLSVLAFLFVFALGVIFGVIASILFASKKTHGRFVVNSKEPSADVFSIEFSEPIDKLVLENVIRLKVDTDF